MKRTVLIITVASTLAACSGSGTSTTARGSAGETEGDSMSSADSNGEDSDPSGSGPSSDGPTTDDPSGETSGGQTSDPTTDSDSDSDPTASDTDDPTSADTGSTSGDIEPVTIQGTWLSEGSDIAPLLVELTNAVSITGTFGENSYDVTTIDGDGQEVNQTGVYIVEPSGIGEIMNITLEQSTPQTITAEGIYQIDNSTNPPTMLYEVVQTVPSVGAQEPTAELGFGGTSLGSDLTQTFVWQ